MAGDGHLARDLGEDLRPSEGSAFSRLASVTAGCLVLTRVIDGRQRVTPPVERQTSLVGVELTVPPFADCYRAQAAGRRPLLHCSRGGVEQGSVTWADQDRLL